MADVSMKGYASNPKVWYYCPPALCTVRLQPTISLHMALKALQERRASTGTEMAIPVPT